MPNIVSTQRTGNWKLAALALLLSGVLAIPAPDSSSTDVAANDSASTEPFSYEALTLTDADVEEYPEISFDEITYTEGASSKRSASDLVCKVISVDSKWPTSKIWGIVNFLTGKRLIPTVPLAAPCYNGEYYNATRCAEITASWHDSDLHDQDPTSIMSPFYQGATCMPTTDPTGSCTLGGYPNYVIKAKTVFDIQVAVNFARNFGVRLVVKNTGHDFSGKSSGANSISVWTHFFNDIKHIPKFNRLGWSGPAFKVGAGVQGRDVYAAAKAQGLVVVGGEGMTVGYAGGYLAGGGHSPLSSIYGMGADHVLEYEVVTGDGRFVTANAERNSDLFWALRGGGGSTFGIVTSVIVKAYPDLPVTTATFSFSSTDLEAYWDAVKVYFSTFITNADAGTYSYFSIFTGTFNMAPFFAPNLSAAEVTALLQPLFDKLDSLNIEYTPVITEHESFFDAWQATFPKELVGYTTVQTASRLFPRANWVDDATFDETFAVIRSVIEEQGMLLGFNMKNEFPGGGEPDNSVNPAWRQSVLHAIGATSWDASATPEEIQAKRDYLTNVQMQKWRDITPGSGAYLGESDIQEPNFQQAFYGENYARLHQLKQRFDPKGVFYARTAVGSEDWTLDLEGRLCPN
ncbi:hypothetical protein DFP73DRAFT_501095 [Morchella snyderi]|nr:hypothetical protein DFP73DRAFT_501095 [Morchella snyderi]